MKQKIFLLGLIFCCVFYAKAQSDSTIHNKKSKIDTNFIYKITQFPSVGRWYVFPVTLDCNGNKIKVIVDNGYFYMCLEKKFGFTQEEYKAYIRDVLINEKTVPFCLEERIEYKLSKILMEEIKYYNNTYINEYRNDMDKFLKWAFDENRELTKYKFTGMIVEILYENKIAIHYGCEGGYYFYSKSDEINW
ncbi:MAG: hypothetical protein PHI14_04650 [Bacteroidales bacterium]|nr:hypothetical protein [Bacteroidales bacterium]